ncbi:MaoC family dehydratase [Roseomonas sp. AR75]|uniref:MaoC family dehydratase n=1 Tax=Roseomonas sp. AR75 TaxID=2562311 RepID=UPI0010BF8872|nr:MaoC family dehydratase [Roseomonas sp. AR75]
MSEGVFYEDLAVGQKASFGKTITEADIVLFAAVTGDTNPMHLNEEYAKGTIFGERIAHGMLAAGLITKVMGTQLPGPGTIYLSQNLKFRRPVRIGDTVTATVEITALSPEKHRVSLRTVCAVRGEPVLEGEALVTVPSRAGHRVKEAAE